MTTQRTMKTKLVLNSAANLTVVNDGQVVYPVLTTELEAWVDRNGPITPANYEAFCDAVECIGEREVGTPGSAAMVDLCDELIRRGCNVCRPA